MNEHLVGPADQVLGMMDGHLLESCRGVFVCFN
jgi:hypothetical protein